MLLKQLLILLLLVSFMHGVAQEKEVKFLLSDTKAKLTNFYAEVTPGTSWSSLMDNSVSLYEISGGLIINHRFTLAFFLTTGKPVENIAVPVYGSTEYQQWLDAGVKVDKLNSNTEFVYARFQHSGLIFGYLYRDYNTFFWRGNFHLGVSGGFNLSEGNNFLGMFDNKIYEAKVITLEPSIGLGVNLLPWWRLYLDTGYRFINIDDRIIKSKKVDSFTFKFGFAFGNFRYIK